MAGALAGITCSVCLYPLELTRTRMALPGEISRLGSGQLMLKTVQNEGFFGLYKGMGPSILGIIVYKGFGFGFYESIYKANSRLPINDFWLNFMSGTIAGSIGQVSKKNLKN